jgi:outer membrane protein OmpA-like peptidoglycan-associated protein
MAQVQLIDLDNDSTSYSVKADPITGNYLAIINSGNTYGLFVSYPGYLFSSTYFEASDSLKPSEIDFPMVKISKGGRATLNNLFFDFNKATLRPQSISELKRLSLMMLQNPTMNITIEGHTDDVGTDIANQALSEKRAQSVSEYLVSQKVPASRLKTVGYGKTRPKVKEGGAQSENRRIEFVVN